MSSVRETEIQKKIMDYLEGEGAVVYKTISLSKSGFPDVMGVLRGKHIHIEVKKPGEEPTVLQRYKMKLLSDEGSIGGWAISVEEAKDLVSSLL